MSRSNFLGITGLFTSEIGSLVRTIIFGSLLLQRPYWLDCRVLSVQMQSCPHIQGMWKSAHKWECILTILIQKADFYSFLLYSFFKINRKSEIVDTFFSMLIAEALMSKSESFKSVSMTATLIFNNWIYSELGTFQERRKPIM